MRGIHCALEGRLGQDVELRRSKSGKDCVTAEVEDLRQFLGECTRGILDAIPQLPRPEARREAAQPMAIYARNHSYSLASLRSALSRYPGLVAQVPDKPGPVNTLPLGTAKLAVLKDRRVVGEEAFSGVPEVKA